MANDEKRTMILYLTKKYVTASPKMWPSTVKDPENWIVNRQNRKKLNVKAPPLPTHLDPDLMVFIMTVYFKIITFLRGLFGFFLWQNIYFEKCSKPHGKASERIWIFKFFEGGGLCNLIINPYL